MRTRLTLLIAMLSVAGACRHRSGLTPMTTTASARDSALAAERSRMDSLARLDSMARESVRDSIARAALLEQTRADSMRREEESRGLATADVRRVLTTPISFEYDRSELSDAARALLDAKASALAAHPDIRLSIAGHTDSRGSDEYNLALGQRRAASVGRYLSQRGIAASRFDIVSFGEERPRAPGDNEAAWSQNRRAEFEISGGMRTP